MGDIPDRLWFAVIEDKHVGSPNYLAAEHGPSFEAAMSLAYHQGTDGDTIIGAVEYAREGSDAPYVLFLEKEIKTLQDRLGVPEAERPDLRNSFGTVSGRDPLMRNVIYRPVVPAPDAASSGREEQARVIADTLFDDR